MAVEKSQEYTKLQCAKDLGNLEFLHAMYKAQHFPRHMHEEFCIGVMVEGKADVSYRGFNHAVPTGSLITLNSGEVHANRSVQGTYRMLYPEADVLKQVASEIVERERDVPFFSEPIIHDRFLYNLILQLNIALEEEVSNLRREDLLIRTLAHLIKRLADSNLVVRSVGRERQAVRLVREYLEAYYFQNISLKQLAQIVNLSPFHLTRVFRKEVGLPVHSYQLQMRINKAKKLLLEAWQISHVAQATGFVDQSHFANQFKRFVGVTPKQYLRCHEPKLLDE